MKGIIKKKKEENQLVRSGARTKQSRWQRIKIQRRKWKSSHIVYPKARTEFTNQLSLLIRTWTLTCRRRRRRRRSCFVI